PLPPETELSRQMTTSTTSIDIMGLQAAYANLHTDQERDYFMQRYHDVISSFRSEERFSRNAETDLVCRLLLEKKNDVITHHTTLHTSSLSSFPITLPPPTSTLFPYTTLFRSSASS